MPLRGLYHFEINNSDDVINSANNIGLLRNLWLDRDIISFDELGPGDLGDFDYGACHSSCHLTAAGGVCMDTNGNLSLLEIAYNHETGIYVPILILREGSEILTIDLNSSHAQKYLLNSKTVGFVEGTSEGRISAGGIVLGSLLLALAQNLDVWYISSQWQDAIAFAILLIFLLFKPEGFNGKKLKKASV